MPLENGEETGPPRQATAECFAKSILKDGRSRQADASKTDATFLRLLGCEVCAPQCMSGELGRTDQLVAG